MSRTIKYFWGGGVTAGKEEQGNSNILGGVTQGIIIIRTYNNLDDNKRRECSKN